VKSLVHDVRISGRPIFATGFVLLFLLATVVFVVPPARAATAPVVLYVSQSGNDSMGDGSVANPFATISHAVGLAPSGATVVVSPGTYAESVMIKKTLTLASQSTDPSNTVINAVGQPNGIVVLGSAAANTIIKGFTVMNANNHGIFVQDSHNIIVENNIVSHSGLNPIVNSKGVAYLGENKAITLYGTSNSTVAGNKVLDNLYGGISVNDDGPTGGVSWNSTAVPSAGIPNGSPNPADGNTISGNLVSGNHPNHCSIVISAYNPGEGTDHNVVSFNDVVDNTAGIIIAADTANTQAIGNSVLSNTILNNGEAGVVIHSNALGDVVTGNVISGNVISNDGSGPKITGILVGGEGPVAAQNTTITDNTFQVEYTGIQIVNGKLTFVGGNQFYATVKVPINGTVTNISPPSTGGSSQTTTILTTVTVSATSGGTGNASQTASSANGGLSFSLALVTAVATLIVGLVVGIVVRPPRDRDVA
jgi:parallel beta-helix repeat protein